MDDDVVLCLHIAEKNKEPKIYKTPISKRKFWERPYYFDILKKKLINFIKKTNTNDDAESAFCVVLQLKRNCLNKLVYIKLFEDCILINII